MNENTLIRVLRRCLFGTSALLGVAACKPFNISKDPVEIVGSFGADGSCHVMADGMLLYAPAESARTEYESGRAINVAPPGYDVHELICSPLVNGVSSLPEGRLFFLTFAVKHTDSVRAGTYTIRHNADMSSEPMTMSAGYFHPKRYGIGTEGAGHGGVGDIYLDGVSGTATFTRLDSAGAVGKFHFQGIREWSF
jgi:hypothetical protein